MWTRYVIPAFLAAGFIFPLPTARAQERAPAKVVSLDYCADQYVLALADHEQIAGLSRGADKGYSFFADKTSGLPRLYGTIDEILYHHPDVVVQSWGLSTRMKELAGDNGIVVIETEYGSDPDVVFRNVLRIGSSLGQEARAVNLVAEYRERLDRLADLPDVNLRAAYVTPSGYTSGRNTFVDEIIQRAGFKSWAASRGLNGWQVLPLEDLLLDPPDLIIASFFDTSLSSQSNWSIARHGRLYDMLIRLPTVDLPGRYLACNGLFLNDAAERIRSDAEKVLAARSDQALGEGNPVR